MEKLSVFLACSITSQRHALEFVVWKLFFFCIVLLGLIKRSCGFFFTAVMGNFCGALERVGYKGCRRADIEHPHYFIHWQPQPWCRDCQRKRGKVSNQYYQAGKTWNANRYAALGTKVFPWQRNSRNVT